MSSTPVSERGIGSQRRIVSASDQPTADVVGNGLRSGVYRKVVKGHDFLLPRRSLIVTTVFLAALGLAVFQKTLWFVPGDSDDLRILSSVARTANPLIYFKGDWGMGLYHQGERYEPRSVYRPLHSLAIWVSYRVFDVSAAPNQLFNLLLHFINILLLFRIVRRIGADSQVSALLGGIALVSIYTVSPASWVSDRSTLIVALMLLLLVDHLLAGIEKADLIRPWYIALVSVIGLLSKESGLIVPSFALLAGIFCLAAIGQKRRRVIITSLLVIGSYVILRFLIFRTAAASFSESGYLFGVRAYDDWASLPSHLQMIALVENVIKNGMSTVLPVFNNAGGLDFSSPPMWIPSVALFVLAFRLRLTLPQQFAAIILILNSAIHCQIFRHRVQYIPLLAFCMFVAGSPALRKDGIRKFVALGAAAVLLCASILSVNRYLHDQWLIRYRELNNRQLSTIIEKYPDQISPEIVEKVIKRYSTEK